ncbi:hypothetical protein BKA70DRAFT_1201425 [Coprinopsis sp. MPI-PUGE-AT-0042]|nr:hypothetical protein BKA70DRAFT_1201425 [Coprinopsis sp. MPI-PUGE-AT-0042]
MLPPQNYLAWKVCVTVLHVVAICSTVLRVRIRWKDARLWWDDYVAAATALVDVVFVITYWLLFGTHAESTTPLTVTKSCVLNMALYFPIFWSSRVSLALSTARVFPPGTLARRTLITMAVLFFGLCIFTFTLNGAICIWPASIYSLEMIPWEEFRNCQPGTMRFYLAVGITAATEFLSDIMSIVIPLKFLWRLTLPPTEQRLIRGAILATLLTAFCGVATCIFWFKVTDLGKDFRVIVAGVRHQQAAASLFVCNLLVVVTYWWRKVHRKNGPTPRRHGHNDPNIPTSKTSSQSPYVVSGSRSSHVGVGSSTDLRRSVNPASSSRLPDNLSFTPITPLGAGSSINPVWTE